MVKIIREIGRLKTYKAWNFPKYVDVKFIDNKGKLQILRKNVFVRSIPFPEDWDSMEAPLSYQLYFKHDGGEYTIRME